MSTPVQVRGPAQVDSLRPSQSRPSPRQQGEARTTSHEEASAAIPVQGGRKEQEEGGEGGEEGAARGEVSSRVCDDKRELPQIHSASHLRSSRLPLSFALAGPPPLFLTAQTPPTLRLAFVAVAAAFGRSSLSEVQIGSKISGQVISLVPFGAYVDIGCEKDALLHVRDMSPEEFVSHPREVVAAGDDVDVYVKYAKDGKVGLSLIEGRLQKEVEVSGFISTLLRQGGHPYNLC